MGKDRRSKHRGAEGPSSEQSQYLAEGWFPINRNLLEEIQKKIKAGGYGSVETLVQDIAKDFSLFVHVLRNSAGLLSSEVRGSEPNPFRLLHAVGLESLQSILPASPESVSPHLSAEMSRDQGLCLKSALISSGTAELLGEKVGTDPGMALSASLLRHTGLSLVAWNYPRIYLKALAGTSTIVGGSLDWQLTKVLGYSPRNMGIRLALPGQFNPGLLAIVGERHEDADDTGLALPEDVRLAAKFCAIGETFAKVSDPEHFPISQKEWGDVVSHMHYFLGENAVAKVLDRVNAHLSEYSEVTPKNFDVTLSPEKNVKLSSLYHGKRLLSSNAHVAKCNELLRTKFQAVYSAMTPGEVSIRALEILLMEVIPWAGFARGCLYLLDRDSAFLVPRLKIGDAKLSRYKPVRCETEVITDHPIANALLSSIPIKQKDILLHGERISHISGAVGRGDRGGVLYLELAESAIDSLDNEQMVFFRAIQQAVNDCLGI